MVEVLSLQKRQRHEDSSEADTVTSLPVIYLPVEVHDLVCEIVLKIIPYQCAVCKRQVGLTEYSLTDHRICSLPYNIREGPLRRYDRYTCDDVDKLRSTTTA